MSVKTHGVPTGDSDGGHYGDRLFEFRADDSFRLAEKMREVASLFASSKSRTKISYRVIVLELHQS